MDNDKLRHFTDAILSDAQQEADGIYQEIARESKEVLSAADDAALAEAFRYVKAEKARIEADCGRQLSRAIMANKREIFLRRETMADEVMEAVCERLSVFTGTPGYAGYLERVFTKLLDTFRGDVVVYLRPEDRAMEELLVSPRYKVTFADGNFSMGGLEVSCPEKRLHADATFDSRVHDLRSHFSELFGLSLGE